MNNKRKSRFNSRELRLVKAYLTARDGSKCNICKHPFPQTKLIVEHIDNDPLNWDPDNLQLACQPCNIKKDPKGRPALKKDVDKRGEGDGGRGRLRLFNQVKQVLNLDALAMFKNVYGELKFFDWLKKEMSSRFKIPVEEIVYDGANITGLQPKTTREYLKKLCYKTGPYKRETEEATGIEYLQWKQSHFPFKHLLKKFSK